MQNILISLILSILLLTGCARTITETKIEYIQPEIPESIISPCDTITQSSFTTNGELLMSYISLQSSYIICASKVSSVRLILQSFSSIYKTL
jgi:hypothetical protein